MKKGISTLLIFLLLASCTDGDKNNKAEQNQESMPQEAKENIVKEKLKKDWGKMNLRGKVNEVYESDYTVVTYSSNGQDKGEELNSVKSIFDANGNLVEETHYGPPKGKVLIRKYTIAYKYDDNGNRTEAEYKDYGGTFFAKIIYKCDDKGNIIEENLLKSDGTPYDKFTYAYDSTGKVIQKNKFNLDGSLFFKSIIKYNNSGDQIEEIAFKSDGSLLQKDSCIYIEFDKNMNWIKKNIYNEGGAVHKERVIAYF
jgi:hypothetical protein